MWFEINTFCSESSRSAREGSKGLKLVWFLCIFIFSFTQVQSTEGIFVIYNLTKNRCLGSRSSNIVRNVARNVATVATLSKEC